MTGEKIISVAGAIVTVALVTTLVSNENTSKIIKAIGDAFAGSLRAAMGKPTR